MSDDIRAVLGSTEGLHGTTTRVKVVVPFKQATGVSGFDLASHPNVARYATTRASVKLVSPISWSLVGPGSADVLYVVSATVVPSGLTQGPSEVDQLADDPCSQNISVTALNPCPVSVLELPEGINNQLKPQPLVGHNPHVLYGWRVTTTGKAFGRIEFSFTIALDGIDWVAPSSWKSQYPPSASS
jgi:hypothetical protein